MLDREIGLAGPEPDNAAQKPAAGEARVERERTVDQPRHGTDILAKSRKHEGGVGEDARVVLARLERLPGKIAGFVASCLRYFGPAFSDEPQVAGCRPGECRPVMPIDRDRLLEQSQGFENLLSRYWIERRKRAQVEIIGAEVGRWPRGGAAHLGRLQGRLHHTGDAYRHLVLKLEYVVKRAVEMVGLQMRAGNRIDQLSADPHPLARLANRALQNIADPQLAPDLFHINDAAFVGEARIAGDDEEPADLRERGNDFLDHAVGEIFLLRVAAHIGERQYRDRRLVGERERW